MSDEDMSDKGISPGSFVDGTLMYCTYCQQHVVPYAVTDYQYYYFYGLRFTTCKFLSCPICSKSNTLRSIRLTQE